MVAFDTKQSEVDGGHCLRCGTSLFDAGGLRRCRDCGWVERRPAD